METGETRRKNDKAKKGKKVLKLGIEPKTFALLARRSNQLSYSSSEKAVQILYIQYLPIPWFSNSPMQKCNKRPALSTDGEEFAEELFANPCLEL